MIIRVQSDDFDLSAINREMLDGRHDAGAVASFVGLVRDLEGGGLKQMTLEHYPGMTEKALQAIADKACERWQVLDLAVIHRVGDLHPGDQIVMVSVLGAHRGDAFAACEFIMDYLKTDAPFWKKETSDDGEQWVASRQSDYDKQQEWED